MCVEVSHRHESTSIETEYLYFVACRYIITSPDRNILSRPELDAFLATAFSPHMLNVDYTQELVVSIKDVIDPTNIRY